MYSHIHVLAQGNDPASLDSKAIRGRGAGYSKTLQRLEDIILVELSPVGAVWADHTGHGSLMYVSRMTVQVAVLHSVESRWRRSGSNAAPHGVEQNVC